MDMSQLTVTGIEMVVFLTNESSAAGFTPVEGILVKQFGPRRYHGIILKTEGTNKYIVEDKYSLTATQGDILYLPQGRPYIVQSGKPGDCYCVNFYIAENADIEPFLMTPRNKAKWQELFASMTHSWTYRGPGYRARCHAILYEMLCMIEEDRQARYLPAKHVNAIRGAVKRLEDHLGEADTQITGMCAECGMSETYFRRLFRDMYGMSPKQYAMEARFMRAKALLETSDAPITHVANATGFESIYHFSRAFRAHEGVSPTEYRQRRK